MSGASEQVDAAIARDKAERLRVQRRAVMPQMVLPAIKILKLDPKGRISISNVIDIAVELTDRLIDKMERK